MTDLILSDDVRALNPELAGCIEYRSRPERLQIASDGFDSQLERDYHAELMARGYEVMPHGLTLHLPGGVDYTPDFVAWSGEIYPMVVVYEVKGNLKQKNARDSRTRFRIAAGLYSCFVWVWVTRKPGGQWCETTFRSNGQ